MNSIVITLVVTLAGMLLHMGAYQLRGRRIDHVESGRVVLYGFMALVGLAFALFGWSVAFTEAEDPSNWPTATGTITSFDEDEVDNNRGVSFSGDVSDPLILVNFAYVYTVDGIEYTGTQRFVDESLVDGRLQLEPDELEAVATQYPVGATVEVYYNPNDPAESALETASNTPYIIVGVGAGVLGSLMAGIMLLPIVQSVWFNHGNKNRPQ